MEEQPKTANERIRLIIDEAEKAAEGIIGQAEDHARRYLEGWRQSPDRLTREGLEGMASLTDSLMRQIEMLRQQADDLVVALEAVKGEIEALDKEDLPTESEQEPLELADTSSSAGARLLASQMAASGSSREEIEERLRNEFGIQDAASVLPSDLGE